METLTDYLNILPKYIQRDSNWSKELNAAFFSIRSLYTAVWTKPRYHLLLCNMRSWSEEQRVFNEVACDWNEDGTVKVEANYDIPVEDVIYIKKPIEDFTDRFRICIDLTVIDNFLRLYTTVNIWNP